MTNPFLKKLHDHRIVKMYQNVHVNARYKQRLDTRPQNTWGDREQVKYIGMILIALIAYAYYNQGSVNKISGAAWSINNLFSGFNNALDELQELMYKFRTFMK